MQIEVITPEPVEPPPRTFVLRLDEREAIAIRRALYVAECVFGGRNMVDEVDSARHDLYAPLSEAYRLFDEIAKVVKP